MNISINNMNMIIRMNSRLRWITLLMVNLMGFAAFGEVIADPHRFDDAIAAFEKADGKFKPEKGKVLFLGSSSIRRWDTATAFAGIDSLNRGFGGSQISDSIFFFDRVVLPYAPSVIVFYAGDNDINAGKTIGEVLADFRVFARLVNRKLKGTKILYIPIKPSISRESLWEGMGAVNKRIQRMSAKQENLYYADIATPMLATGMPPSADLFAKDGLHLSDKGNAMWLEVIRPVLEKALSD